MPGRDQTGPRGEGPMTGRRGGRCADPADRDDAPFGPGRGRRQHRRRRFGRGRGAGQGWRGADIDPAPSEHLHGAEDRCAALEAEVAGLRRRLDELDAG
jgi:uncharacterized protein YceH (UPF0502 family)